MELHQIPWSSMEIPCGIPRESHGVSIENLSHMGIQSGPLFCGIATYLLTYSIEMSDDHCRPNGSRFSLDDDDDD